MVPQSVRISIRTVPLTAQNSHRDSLMRWIRIASRNRIETGSNRRFPRGILFLSNPDFQKFEVLERSSRYAYTQLTRAAPGSQALQTIPFLVTAADSARFSDSLHDVSSCLHSKTEIQDDSSPHKRP